MRKPCDKCGTWVALSADGVAFESMSSAHIGSMHTEIQCAGAMDADLKKFSHDELVAEVKRLRKGIRAHRDRSGHDLCWLAPEIWGLLPEKFEPKPCIPP